MRAATCVARNFSEFFEKSGLGIEIAAFFEIGELEVHGQYCGENAA